MKTSFKLLTFTLILASASLTHAQEIQKSYYDDGTIEEEGAYNASGDATGEWKFYNEDGALTSVGYYSNGLKTGEWIYYHENGKLFSSGDFHGITGFPIGIWIDYYDNGQVQSKGEHNGDGGFDTSKKGEWKFYYDNGQLQSSGNYTDETGEKIGSWKGYFKNGDVDYLISFDDQGNKNGHSISKNENGTLFQEVDYINGKIYNISTYNDRQGNPLKIGSLSNGNGTLNEYINGSLVNEWQLVDGLFESDSVFIEDNWDGYSYLNSSAWKVYENPYSSSDQLKFAILWAKRSIELSKTNYNTDTLAALLYRTGDYTKALSMAKESLALGKQANEDTSITEKLIESIRIKL